MSEPSNDFSGALAVARELGLNLPDSRAVGDAYAQAQAESQPWLFNHVARSWLYGASLARHRALDPDAELVAVSVLLHDLGLTRGGAPDRRFEVVGASNMNQVSFWPTATMSLFTAVISDGAQNPWWLSISSALPTARSLSIGMSCRKRCRRRKPPTATVWRLR